MTTLYVVVGPSSWWSNPAASEVKAGRLAGGAAALAFGSRPAEGWDGTFDFVPVTGLSTETTIRLAYVWSDGAQDSDVAVSGEITTYATDFPTVDGVAYSTLNGSVQTVSLPAHAAGDRLVVFYSADGGASNYVSHSAGWSLFGPTSEGTALAFSVFEKIATSSGESLEVTLGASRNVRAIALNIGGAHASQALEIAWSQSSDVSNSANPPSLTPSWGSSTTLWIACYGQDNASVLFRTYPPLYENTYSNDAVFSTATPRVAVATRRLVAASEDPGSFVLAGGEQWIAATIAIRPAGGAGPSTWEVSVTEAATGDTVDAASMVTLSDFIDAATASALQDWVASAAPVLSNATVINITSSGATPRVTVTFS